MHHAEMGLHLCYDFHLPGTTSASDAARLTTALHDRARTLPFDKVSDIVSVDETMTGAPKVSIGWTYRRLEDVALYFVSSTREDLYRASVGISPDDYQTRVDVPDDAPVMAYAFAVAPGRGCEPATFGLVQLRGASEPSAWSWHYCCKTQYASVVSDDHLLRCHCSLVTLLDHAQELGITLAVGDETGYWESRDPQKLIDAVTDMNRIVAGFAGQFTDAVRDAGLDSHQVQGSIFEHPDFERLESEE